MSDMKDEILRLWDEMRENGPTLKQNKWKDPCYKEEGCNMIFRV